MKPAETKEIYERACRQKRLVPQQDEGELWHKSLRNHEAQDVKAALDAWWASTATDDRGELKSKWLPAPGELIPLVIAAERKRLYAQQTPKVLVGWECEQCRYRASNYVELGVPKVSKCPHCKSVMAEIHREVAA